jgi:hypothetical protein
MLAGLVRTASGNFCSFLLIAVQDPRFALRRFRVRFQITRRYGL